MITEKEASKEIREFLKRNGWFVVRNQQNIGSMKGISDFVAISQGVTIWIEVKGERGRMSDNQLWFANRLAEHGGVYILARSKDDVLKWCEEKLGRNKLKILFPYTWQSLLINQLELFHGQGAEEAEEIPQGAL